MGFLKSSFSGYLSLALILAILGGGIYLYRHGMTVERLQQAADQLAAVEADIVERRGILAKQSKAVAATRKELSEAKRQRQEALKDAPKSFVDCMSMPVPDGMRDGQREE